MNFKVIITKLFYDMHISMTQGFHPHNHAVIQYNSTQYLMWNISLTLIKNKKNQ